MTHTIATRLARAVLACSAIALLAPGATAHAQELKLEATAKQGALATYSGALDVRAHALWGDRRAALDLKTVRVTGEVRNAGKAPLRVAVFAVPEADYGRIAKNTGSKALAESKSRALALFWIKIGPSTSVSLSTQEPRDPAALARMLSDGPVRFGVVADAGSDGQAVGMVVSALNLTAGSAGGDVSLLDARSFPGEIFFPGDMFVPGDPLFVEGVSMGWFN